MAEDVRWKQRFSNFKKALGRLSDAVALSKERDLSELEEQGLVQSFEYTHELAWNVLKDFMEEQSPTPIYGSKDAVRASFRAGLIENGDVWMEMIKSRNDSSHTYDEQVKNKVIKAVLELYYPQFLTLREKMDAQCASD
jgi:nucleotidyltransferase substrate binding protein (TIGR01987 family)